MDASRINADQPAPLAEPDPRCAVPAPNGTCFRCSKPRGHDGPHWTEGGGGLAWFDVEPGWEQFSDEIEQAVRYVLASPTDVEQRLREMIAAGLHKLHAGHWHAASAAAIPSEEPQHRAWYPHTYGQRGNCGCESCTKAKLAVAEAKLNRIEEVANADAKDLAEIRDGTKLTRHGVVQVLAWQQEEIAAAKERLRKTAQTIIAAIGADGPQNAEEAADRIVQRLEQAESRLAELEAEVGRLRSANENLADRVSCLKGKLSNEQPRQAEVFAERIAKGELAFHVIREAMSEYKSFYNLSCEWREEGQRKITELDAENATAGGAEAGRQASHPLPRRLQNSSQRNLRLASPPRQLRAAATRTGGEVAGAIT